VMTIVVVFVAERCMDATASVARRFGASVLQRGLDVGPGYAQRSPARRLLPIDGSHRSVTRPVASLGGSLAAAK
jgi:hypothetical protein